MGTYTLGGLYDSLHNLSIRDKIRAVGRLLGRDSIFEELGGDSPETLERLESAYYERKAS